MVTDSVANLQDAFSRRLRRRADQVGSWLCIGLDPDSKRLPVGLERNANGVGDFCGRIVDATQQHALCYKLNFAFFEALGPEGWRVLQDVRGAIPADIPVIADAKRGDIPSTMAFYAQAVFEVLDFDAVTLSPYLGWEALEPFLIHPGRAAFVLARTSNPGAGQFQDLAVDGDALYLRVAREAAGLRRPTEVGVVAGATDPASLQQVRALDEGLLILVPGAGAQGASPADAFRYASNRDGQNALITMSRSILYASAGEDFAEAAEEAARDATESMRSERAG